MLAINTLILRFMSEGNKGNQSPINRNCTESKAKMASKEIIVKEPSWRLSLVLGVSLIALCLSLLCIVHLLLVPGHQVCECKPDHTQVMLGSKIEKFVEEGTRESDTTIKHNEESTERGRKRRNVFGSANVSPMYQVQRQLMLLETRVRIMQDEMFKRRSPGPRGPIGPSGSPGRNGLDGRPGMDGPMGMPGRDGKRGKDGNNGPPGAPGPPGVNGLTGLTGPQGLKGLKGMMGDKGGRGLPGPKGDRGLTGTSGENGEPGMPGAMGRKGEKGDKGSTECYVTKRGRRYIKPCYLAPYPDDDDVDDASAKQAPSGVMYTRWGRTACPARTVTVYSGQAAATHHGPGRLGGSLFKCLPSKPWYFSQRTQSDALRNSSARANPEQEMDIFSSFYYVQCAVCLAKTRSIQVMLPARKECYRGWHREYDGFLGVQINKDDHKDIVCVDRDAQDSFRANDFIQALRADCKSFSCPPYARGERLPCVVCTM